MPAKNMILQKLGGSYQFIVTNEADLRFVISFDEAHWAALSVPCKCMNCDQKLLEYLDANHDGWIRTDEIKAAASWLTSALSDLSNIEKQNDELELKAINRESQEGLDIYNSVIEIFSIEEPQDVSLSLDQVRDKQQELVNGPLQGDGIITLPAISDPDAAAMAADIIETLGGVPNKAEVKGVTPALLDNFLADANGFIEWQAQKADSAILSMGENTAIAYNCFCSIRDKVDEFFEYCDLIQLDNAQEKRFQLDPAALPPLDINDSEAVKNTIQKAPLAPPTARGILRLDRNVNPAFQAAIDKFKEIFKLTSLTLEQWQAVKSDLAPYEAYLNNKAGSSVETLGTEKLSAYLGNQAAIDELRKLFDLDNQLMDKLIKVAAMEKLLLFNRYIITFVNNFVSFHDLFQPGSKSMIEAGTLILDGRHFELNIRIDNIAVHKKTAQNSNICILYLKLTDGSDTMNVATAVTSGRVNNIYIGKRGIFFSNDMRKWNAEIIDIIPAAVSLRQALALPFNKLGDYLSQKIEKFSASRMTGLEKNIDTNVSALEKAPPPAAKGKNIAPMMMLGGGVGVAALGSGFAYMAKSLKEVSLLKILLTLAGIVLMLSLPIIIAALIKLRRRNLALFLEAAEWAINLPMRLNKQMGALFTYTPAYPANMKKKRHDLMKGFLRQAEIRVSSLPQVLTWIGIIFLIAVLLISLFPALLELFHKF